MALFRRLTLLSLVVALLLSPPEVGTVSGEVGGIVDETLVWNQVMLDAIVASTLGNPQTMRMAATVNTAMFDARNGVSQKYRPIFVTQTAPPGTHRRAAVVQAAHITLKAFYPAQLARFDKQRALSLAAFNGDEPANVQRGIDWGENVANQVLAWRATDGFSNPVPPFNGAGAVIGQWESATGASMSPGNIPFTAPFVLTSNTQFQSAFPRPWASLDSAGYAASFNEVATMGAKTGSLRTSDQTHIAFFFNGYATNDYVEAAIQIAKARQTSRPKNSRKPQHRSDLRLGSPHHDTESPRVPGLAPGITRLRPPRAPALLRRRERVRASPRVQHRVPGTSGGRSPAAALYAHLGHGAGRHRRPHLRRHAPPRREQCNCGGGRPNRRLHPCERRAICGRRRRLRSGLNVSRAGAKRVPRRRGRPASGWRLRRSRRLARTPRWPRVPPGGRPVQLRQVGRVSIGGGAHAGATAVP